jgi:hypothetical protein
MSGHEEDEVGQLDLKASSPAQKESKMGIVRIYTGDDARSHIEELAHVIPPFGTPEIERTQSATGIAFLRRDRDTFSGYHNTPRRQYIFILTGSLQFEVGDGGKCMMGPGEVVLVEDVTGEGHITRGVADTAFVHLA